MEAWVAWLMELFRSEHIEFALFAAAFISATVLPGGSEAVLAGAVAGTPSRVVEFVLIAMLGNALGGMTGWCIGRFIPERKKEGKALAWLHKYGYWALLMTWLPLFGDALPIAAGWLRNAGRLVRKILFLRPFSRKMRRYNHSSICTTVLLQVVRHFIV